MNQSLKSVIAFLILVTLAAGVLGWTTRGIGGVEGSQFWMRVIGFGCPPLVALLAWADFRKDKAPDLLREAVGSYFERDGFCFAFRVGDEAGRCVWTVWFQNRYERPCRARVSFRPAVKNLGVRRPSLEHIDFELECPGAAFGKVLIPYPVPASEQGYRRSFEVAAVVHYPDGRGALLRFRNGLRVAGRQKSGLDTALMATAALAGHLHYHRAARFTAQLPSNVLTALPPEPAPTPLILWMPDQCVERDAPSATGI